MELIVKSFSLLNLKDNEIYILSDFNINLLQNGIYILNRKEIAACQGPVHTLISKYQEFLSNIFFEAINNLSYLCMCVCVCVCVCVFPSIVKASPD